MEETPLKKKNKTRPQTQTSNTETHLGVFWEGKLTLQKQQPQTDLSWFQGFYRQATGALRAF